MGDFNCGQSDYEPLKVVARRNLSDQRQFIVSRHLLCISPILRDYIHDPQTTPPAMQINGPGSLTFNNEGDVVHAMLEYMKYGHGNDKFNIQPGDRGIALLVQLYKLALSLGLKDLCAGTLSALCSRTLKVEDFSTAAFEASGWGLIDDEPFRRWFIQYVNKHHDELLKIDKSYDDALKLCRILVSALAHAKDDYDRGGPSTPSTLPPTPPSSKSQKRPEDLKPNVPKRILSQFTLKGTQNLSSNAKKRKLNAAVKDASESD